ncbi:MAG: right-handed parallel beta-helix repeat-containing protein, partial [Polyangiaceae bacterium]
NLFAHNNERNPWFKGFATGVIVNNVVYDPGIWAIRLGAVLNEWVDSGITPEGPRVSVVGNVMLHGIDTPSDREFIGSNSNGSAYLEDNLAFDRAGAAAAVVEATVARLDDPPSWPTGLAPVPASTLLEQVLARAGARPADRDAVDQRIVADVRSRSGRIIDSQDDVGGYPTMAATRRALEVPADVDAWLRALAAELE